MSDRERSKNELLIIASVGLLDYYNTQVVPLDKKFHTMSLERNTGLCPFHHDTDPSLHYWKQKGIFHCFGCGFGGDVVKTHMRLRQQYYSERLSVENAVIQLADLFGVALDHSDGFVVKSVFEQARERLLNPASYIIPKGVMSLSEFRQLNNKVRSSHMSINAKISNFEHLDAVASTFLSQK